MQTDQAQNDVLKINKLEKLRLPYELIMISLAIAVSVLVLRELILPLSEEEIRSYQIFDWVVLAAFAIDYFVRLLLSEDKKAFVKKNIPELIAIIPFDNIFRLARLVRVIRLARLFRLFRAAVILRRFSDTFFGILKTNGLHFVLLITVGIILIGSYAIMYLEKDAGHINDFGDALWWSLVTTTTVGYGDISPSTTGGRLLAGFLMIFGIGFLGMLTGAIATFFVEQLVRKKRPDSLNSDIKELIKTRIDNLEHLEQEEVDEVLQIINLYRGKH